MLNHNTSIFGSHQSMGQTDTQTVTNYCTTTSLSYSPPQISLSITIKPNTPFLNFMSLHFFMSWYSYTSTHTHHSLAHCTRGVVDTATLKPAFIPPKYRTSYLGQNTLNTCLQKDIEPKTKCMVVMKMMRINMPPCSTIPWAIFLGVT